MDSNQYGNYNQDGSTDNPGSGSQPAQSDQPYQPGSVNYYDVSSGQPDSAYTAASYDQETSYGSYGQYSQNGDYNQGSSYGGYDQGNQNGTYNQNSTYDQSSSYGSYGQGNQPDPYGQRNGSYNLNGQVYSQAGYQTSYQTGQEKKPHFTVYIVLSIIEAVFSTFFGIAALILTIVANTQYNRGNTKGAKVQLIIARIILIFGLVINLLVVGATVAFIVSGSMDDSRHTSSYSVDVDEDDGAGYDEEDGYQEESWNGEDPKMGELSASWRDFKVALDGEVYELPCKMSELTKNGWTVDDDYEETMVESGKYEVVGFEKDDYYITVYAVNRDSKDKPVLKCLAGGFSVDGKYSNKGITFSVCDGVSLGTGQEEAKAVLGEADYEYVGEADEFWDDYRTWNYYSDGQVYRSLSVTLIDHEISSLAIENIDIE